MDASASANTQTATLPNGTVVEVSTKPDKRWETHFSTFYVKLGILLPDSTQPRKSIDLDKLDGLKISVGEVGVRDPIVVTPTSLVPWMNLTKEEKAFPFLIVSGHRRYSAATDASLSAIPIHVRNYENERQHKEDRLILNIQREGLTQLEEAHEIKGLVDGDISLLKASKEFGCSYQHSRQLMCLLKLHPDIQALLASNIKEEKRFPATVAYVLGDVPAPTAEELEELDPENTPDNVDFLGEDDLRFLLQKYYLRKIQEEKMSAKRAVDFIQGRTAELVSYRTGGRSEKRSEKFEPQKRIKIVLSWVNGVLDSVVNTWPLEKEFKRILANSSRSQTEDILLRFQRARECLDRVIPILEKIRASKPKKSYVDDEMVEARYFLEGTRTHGFVGIERFHELETAGLLAHQVNGELRPKEYPPVR